MSEQIAQTLRPGSGTVCNGAVKHMCCLEAESKPCVAQWHQVDGRSFRTFTALVATTKVPLVPLQPLSVTLQLASWGCRMPLPPVLLLFLFLKEHP